MDAPFNINFDSSTPSIRKVDNREKEKETKRGNKEYNDRNTWWSKLTEIYNPWEWENQNMKMEDKTLNIHNWQKLA